MSDKVKNKDELLDDLIMYYRKFRKFPKELEGKISKTKGLWTEVTNQNARELEIHLFPTHTYTKAFGTYYKAKQEALKAMEASPYRAVPSRPDPDEVQGALRALNRYYTVVGMMPRENSNGSWTRSYITKGEAAGIVLPSAARVRYLFGSESAAREQARKLTPDVQAQSIAEELGVVSGTLEIRAPIKYDEGQHLFQAISYPAGRQDKLYRPVKVTGVTARKSQGEIHVFYDVIDAGGYKHQQVEEQDLIRPEDVIVGMS